MDQKSALGKLLNGMARVLRAFGYTVILLFLVIAGTCVYQINRQSSLGKEWCERTIRNYEADPGGFREMHAGRQNQGILIVRQSAEDKGVMGDFSVDETGEYVCRYWHGGGIGPHGFEYTSSTGEWVKFD